MGKIRPMSAQQRRFIAEYMVDFSAEAAAERAGYSPKNTAAGNHLMRRPQILDEIRRRCHAAEKRLELTGDDIRNFHARVMTDPRQVIDGGPTWEARIASARELGKLLGLYTAKIHVTGTLTLEDLLLAAERKRVELPAVTH